MDLHQQPKPPDGPTAKGAVTGASGLDQVLSFFNGVFSSSTGNGQQSARPSLTGLFGSQQGSPPPASSRGRGSGIGASPSSPTSKQKSPRSSLVAEVEGSHVRENTHSTREPLSPSANRGNESWQLESVETGSVDQPPRSSRRIDRRGQPYEACEDDLLDQHVAYYLRHHPETHAQHSIYRKRPGVYVLDRREVDVEWQYAEDPDEHGFLVIVDGPLRQPFADYMEMTEKNAEYDSRSCNRSSLSSIPREQRMSFHDQHKVYTRLEAMKVAKEQAAFREKHADYLKEGAEVPDDLMMKYKKTIQQKLGQQTPQRRDHGSKSPHRDLTPAQYVMTPPPEQFQPEQGRRRSYTPQSVFASEPLDYFSSPASHGGSSSMWGSAWGATPPPPQRKPPPSQRSTPASATGYNYGGVDRNLAVVTPPTPPPMWQQVDASPSSRPAPRSGHI